MTSLIKITGLGLLAIGATACRTDGVADPAAAPQPPTKLQAPAEPNALTPMPAPWGGAGWLKRHEEFSAIAAKGDVEVVFWGDSITDGWRNSGKAVWNRDLAPLKAANFGIGGDHVENVQWRMDNGELPPSLKPKVAVLMIGTNNTGYMSGAHMEKPEAIAQAITRLVETVNQKSPRTQILLLGIFPRGENPSDRLRQNNEAVNAILCKLDGTRNVRYLDLAGKFLAADGTLSRERSPDLLHLSPQGYEIWSRAIVPEIKQMLESPAKIPEP